MTEEGALRADARMMSTGGAGAPGWLDMCMIVPRPENAIRSGEYPA